MGEEMTGKDVPHKVHWTGEIHGFKGTKGKEDTFSYVVVDRETSEFTKEDMAMFETKTVAYKSSGTGSDDDLHPAAIAGIVAGGLLAFVALIVVAVIVVAVIIIKKSRSSRSSHAQYAPLSQPAGSYQPPAL